MAAGKSRGRCGSSPTSICLAALIVDLVKSSTAKRFFRDEFGKDPVCLWSPTFFGYSGSLPQILAKSGIKYFMTQKLVVELVTPAPAPYLLVAGESTAPKVLAHMPPEDIADNSAAGTRSGDRCRKRSSSTRRFPTAA